MALTEGQVQVGSLVMGRNTPYRLLEFDPWSRQARADQGEPRAWGHGSWSGAEWQAEAIVPMRIRVLGTDAATWLALHQQLAAAFAASSDDVELRWVTGGVEYLMLGRPRMVEPRPRVIGRGLVVTRAAFAALDPTIYSGTEHVEHLVLPQTSGGLVLPFTVPFTIPATVVTGRRTLTNAGTAETGLVLRVDGPVSQPRISLLAGGVSQILQYALDLDVGQWLDLDTAAGTAYLNGAASRRGYVYGDWPVLPGGPAGASGELAFDAAVYDPAARLTVTWRDAWT